ncbi:MAG: uroporphyrinogen-III C-methyltransferase [Devosia sp.]|uniref:siroheme synthase CysG n=1 Tax=Devosia sp. TaxID=1871048 RepID=UPI0019EBBC73|nr:siroheme synthase CysG [Devosia sp.]MBF0678073.1 uroporphyrinogen-III C-methyltransferase [Devosia sp.]
MVTRKPSQAQRPRLAPLSTLPVFYALTGKRVLLAGGAEAAAWKAELLAATGAIVEVAAHEAELSEEMQSLASSGRVALLGCHWTVIGWDGYAMAIGDCEDDEEAAHFASAARRFGVPVNVIDKPTFCDFQFGSIVNRSPLVVGISTSGAAPVLGQAARQRIEAMLPKSLSDWAGLARHIRDRATNLLRPGSQRRLFWQLLADRAFYSPAEEAELDKWIAEAKGTQGGSVTLVGAGPGDAEYLTLKALRALQAADVILFDDLVSDDVLELARREAKRILVGKRGGRASCKQEDINRTMIALAKAGRHVVRLKSGDPMIFGRAGEEIAALAAESIPVQVVPGISAAMALAASLNISLTHRDYAQSVRLVTGHSRHGGVPENLDWRALSDPSTTHVYYMAGRNGAAIAARLVSHGMPPHTGVVIASDISRPEEEVLHTTLDDMATMVDPAWPRGPVLILVGGVLERARVSAQAQVARAS